MTQLPASLRRDPWFFCLVAAGELLAVLAILRSPAAGLALAVALGMLALLATAVGTRRGTFVMGAALIAVVAVLPGDLALEYRVPVGGGGVFISDVLLALVVASMLAAWMSRGALRVVRSPVNLPMLLFLGWIGVALAVGVLEGNETKLVLQDLRGLGYYVLFFFVTGFVVDARDLRFMVRLLAVCLVAVFALGVVYAAMGQGMVLEYVEPGVSRFPAPDDLFLIGSVLATSIAVMWPGDRPRPRALWLVLVVALLGLVLSLVRGNYVAFAVAVVYLLLVVRVQERVRLVAGMLLLAAVLGVGLAVARPAVFRSVISRTLAVTQVDDPNVQYRLIENRAVGEEIRDHPLRGNGLGEDYVFDWSRYGVAPYTKSYVHNSYYWLTHRLGLVGLALFVWVAVAFLVPFMRSRAQLTRGDPWLAGLVYGSRAVLVALLVVSVTSPRMNGRSSVTVLAVAMGLGEVARVFATGRDGDEGVAVASQPALPGSPRD